MTKKISGTLLFFLMLTMILTHPELSTYHALNGLNLWFTGMIPALFPFMLLTGFMIRMNLTETIASVFQPLVGTLFRVRKNVTYAIVTGFLCGFPMGAKVTCDLLKEHKISEKEAVFLISFCNNIGPAYVTGYVIPMLHAKKIWPLLAGIYGIPLCYGLFLRYAVYGKNFEELTPDEAGHSELSACSRNVPACFTDLLEETVTSSLKSVAILGGYMILFNLFNIIPSFFMIFLPKNSANKEIVLFISRIAAPVFEITGGLNALSDRLPVFSLTMLSFGGFCCIAQTGSILKKHGLSLSNYVLNKLIVTLIAAVYYLTLQRLGTI